MRDGTHRLSRNGKKISHFFAQSSFAQYAVVHESSAVLVEDRDIPFSVIAPRSRDRIKPDEAGVWGQPGCIWLRYGGNERSDGGQDRGMQDHHSCGRK